MMPAGANPPSEFVGRPGKTRLRKRWRRRGSTEAAGEVWLGGAVRFL
jgi:hypothetical protein